MSKKAAVPAVSKILIEVTKKSSCPSLSGKAELSFERGIDPDGKEYVRLSSTTGRGIFNKHWIDISAIEALLKAHSADRPMTSTVLAPLYKGASSNSKGFLYAVLQSEGIVQIAAPSVSPEPACNVESMPKRKRKEN